MGADQGLYAYAGRTILSGGLPYRDAWDQKPPAIHYTYAVLRALWPGDAAVAAADLVAAGVVAFLLARTPAMAGAVTGPAAALIFLLLSNPAFTRLGGVRLRAQSETFMSVVLVAALVLLLRQAARADVRLGARAMGSAHFRLKAEATELAEATGTADFRLKAEATGSGNGAMRCFGVGALIAIASLYKYNAAIYGAAALATLWLTTTFTVRRAAAMAAGFAVPVVAMAAVFAAGGALRDAWDATIGYNLRYSGETYRGPLDVVRYLMTFPIDRARVDAIWTVGGAGCLALLALAVRDRRRLVPVVWVGAACLSIAINGSRGLPQYFVQANPFLALAAAWGGAALWDAVRPRERAARLVLASALMAIAATAVWRVNQFPKLFEQTWFDTQYMLGHVDRAQYLARYADDRKYSSLDADALGAFLRAHSAPEDTVYVFGFTGASYVYADRTSASRFFWSRPVIVGFRDDLPGYGVAGLLDDLTRRRPVVVALQRHDWAPDVEDSAPFFLATPALAGWLEGHYTRVDGPDAFDVWMRKDRAS